MIGKNLAVSRCIWIWLTKRRSPRWGSAMPIRPQRGVDQPAYSRWGHRKLSSPRRGTDKELFTARPGLRRSVGVVTLDLTA